MQQPVRPLVEQPLYPLVQQTVDLVLIGSVVQVDYTFRQKALVVIGPVVEVDYAFRKNALVVASIPRR